MCTYNGAKYLEEQIVSILNQTHKNIELVIVDDCSSDETLAILNDLANSFTCIKVYQNEINLGFNNNFQKAINLCSGDFIAIADHDDIWIPHKLEVLLANIKDNWLVFSNSELIDKEGKKMNQQILKPNFNLEGKSYKSFLFYNSVTGHTLLINRQFLPYFLPIPSSGYYDWWMGFVAMYHKKATYVNECLTLHRTHSSSVTTAAYSNDKKQLKKDLNLETEIQLEQFTQYKNLKVKDKKFLGKISKEYHKNFSLYLMWLISMDYPTFFPDKKPRNWLSRLNFALKLK